MRRAPDTVITAVKHDPDLRAALKAATARVTDQRHSRDILEELAPGR